MGKTTPEMLKSIKGATFFWTSTRAGFEASAIVVGLGKRRYMISLRKTEVKSAEWQSLSITTDIETRASTRSLDLRILGMRGYIRPCLLNVS